MSILKLSRFVIPWVELRTPPAGTAAWFHEGARSAYVVVLCLTVAILVRASLGQEQGIAAFATLYPAIVVAALLAGFWAGTATLVLGWIAAWYLFFDPPGDFALSERKIISSVLYLLSSGVLILVAVWLRDTISRLERSEARYRALIDATTNVVALTDGNGGWLERNSAWETATGTTWPEYGGGRWLSAVHEEDRTTLNTTLHAAQEEPISTQARLWSQSDEEWRWFGVRSVAIAGHSGDLDDRIITFTDIHERKLLRERQELLTGELRHRLKNLLAVIQSLLNNSLPHDNPVAAALAEKFMSRLRALQSAGDLVIAANMQDVELGAVVNGVLAPFIEENKVNFTIQGPPLFLHEQTAGGFGLASHELATNALKYGALSVQDGRVNIAWSLESVGADERIVWEWTESNGPVATAPEKDGFGLRVIRAAVMREREGTVDIQFPPSGVHCRATFLRTKKPGKQRSH
ncbi:MAG: HWE histidine kinase domain-containing protein [Micropepsaceae bacterium]